MDDAEKTVLLEFTAWAVSEGLLPEASVPEALVEDFARSRESLSQRRKDFLCRLLVCGFAKLLVPAGQAPMEGQVMRGFVPLFAQVLNRVTHGKLPAHLQGYCQELLEYPEVRLADDRLVWPTLAETHRVQFLTVLAEVLFHLAQMPDLHKALDNALDVVAPHGFGIVYSATDVGLVLSAWYAYVLPFTEDGIDGKPFDELCGPGVGAVLQDFYARGIPEDAKALFVSIYGNQDLM